MTPSDVVANIVHGLEYAATKIPQSWKNIKSVHLKTSTSPALPIYSKISNELYDLVKKALPSKILAEKEKKETQKKKLKKNSQAAKNK